MLNKILIKYLKFVDWWAFLAKKIMNRLSKCMTEETYTEVTSKLKQSKTFFAIFSVHLL